MPSIHMQDIQHPKKTQEAIETQFTPKSRNYVFRRLNNIDMESIVKGLCMYYVAPNVP